MHSIFSMRVIVHGFILLFSLAYLVNAQAGVKKFSAPDFSGVYACKGRDARDQVYTSTMRLEIQFRHSQGTNGAYRLALHVSGQGAYSGHAASEGQLMAIHVLKTKNEMTEFGTSIAKFQKNKQGLWMFRSYRYEPGEQDGNFAFEQCTQIE